MTIDIIPLERIQKGEEVSPDVTNRPLDQLYTSINNVVEYLNSDEVQAGFLAGVPETGYARRQNDSTMIPAAGWYRIAVNGPMEVGGTGGTGAHAIFVVRDSEAGFGSAVTFLASFRYGHNPTLVLLGASHYGASGGLVDQIRLVNGSLGEGGAVDIHCTAAGRVSFDIYGDVDRDGWSAVSFAEASVPETFQTTMLSVQEKGMVFGIATNGRNDTLYIKRDGSIFKETYEYFNRGTMGSGSGLDADTVDGIQASAFMQRSNNLNDLQNVATARRNLGIENFNNITVQQVTNIADGTQTGWRASINGGFRTTAGSSIGFFEGSRIDASTPIYIGTGKAGSQTPKAVYINDPRNQNGNPIWHADNDGSGSGLDADTLDGIQGSEFLLKSGGTMTGGIRKDHSGSNWISQKTDVGVPLYSNLTSTNNYAALLRQTHTNMVFTVGGSANKYFGFFSYKPERTTNGTDGSFYMDVNGNCTASGNITAFSDLRLKENIETIKGALDIVNKLRGVRYIRKDMKDGKKHIGLIAQEVKEILPEIVSDPLSEDDYYSVSYGNLVGVLVEAIKELNEKIERIERRK